MPHAGYGDDFWRDVDDEGLAAEGPPIRLDTVELGLDDNDAEAAAGLLDPASDVEARALADSAQRKLLGRPVRDGAPEIIAEAVVVADEARRFVPVAGGDGDTVRAEQVDHGRAGLARDGFELQVVGGRRLRGRGHDPVRHHVLDRWPFTVFKVAAFDLVCGGRAAPEESFGE